MRLGAIQLVVPALALAIGLVGVSECSIAAPAPAKAKPLEDLGDSLLDDAMLGDLIDSAREKKDSDKSADKAKPSATPRLMPDADELRRMLDPPKQPAPTEGEDVGESPLVRISGRMAAASKMIANQNLSGETREAQEEIVTELDKLIEKLNKQCQSCSGGGQCNKPGQQQTQSSTPKPGGGKPSASQAKSSGAAQSRVSAGGGGEAQPGEMADSEAVKQLWGQLPERLRQQLLQSTADEFLPKYRAELQQYFRRLAEEQGSDAPSE
ncbi:hypothetical protein [Aeoliella sp.]|uniref:hypothetical protein n=1 Tax=Aeoliella sp. TaxID=2795800 RepID=UPI003CCB7B63